MQLTITLEMNRGETIGTKKLLTLLAEHRCTCLVTLITQRIQRYLGDSVSPPFTIHMCTPETCDTEIIHTLITMECSLIIFTFFAFLMRLDNLGIGDGNHHDTMVCTLTSLMHRFEACLTEIILTITAIDLRLLLRECGTERTA